MIYQTYIFQASELGIALRLSDPIPTTTTLFHSHRNK